MEANPTSGYDDAIYVVSVTDHVYEQSNTRPTVAFRDEEEAREEADRIRSEPFKNASVNCIGLNH